MLDEYKLCESMAKFCGLEFFWDGFDQPRLKMNEQMSSDGLGDTYTLASVSAMEFFFCKQRKVPTPPGFFYVLRAAMESKVDVGMHILQTGTGYPHNFTVTATPGLASLTQTIIGHDFFIALYTAITDAVEAKKQIPAKV